MQVSVSWFALNCAARVTLNSFSLVPNHVFPVITAGWIRRASPNLGVFKSQLPDDIPPLLVKMWSQSLLSYHLLFFLFWNKILSPLHGRMRFFLILQNMEKLLISTVIVLSPLFLCFPVFNPLSATGRVRALNTKICLVSLNMGFPVAVLRMIMLSHMAGRINLISKK